jgi:hypothetical protein
MQARGIRSATRLWYLAALITVRQASLWTESVFHVLAHVEAPGLAPSCHNPAWIEWAAVRFGLSTTRSLAEDLEVIRRAATTHDALASVQALAWVFDSARACKRVTERELAMLGREDVASFDALTIALAAGPVAEVLRAASELELPILGEAESIPPGQLDTVGHALDALVDAAPSLGRFEIAIARPLGLRGRTLGSSIVVGLPGIGCPDAEHAAWQAAHEATVNELALLRSSSFAELERRALALLRSRARAAGLADAHRRWLDRLDLRALGTIPDVDDASQ